MATVSTLFGASPTALAVVALNGLANGAFWKSAAITWSTNSPAFVTLNVTLVTAATGAGTALAYSDVYLSQSNDGTQYEANITPGDAAWASTNPTTAEYAKSLTILGRIPMGTTQTASYTLSLIHI